MLTSISNELPALYTHLSDADLLKVKTFIADTLSPCTVQEGLELGNFLFRNTLSIAAKLLLPVLESAVSKTEYSALQKQQLSGQIARSNLFRWIGRLGCDDTRDGVGALNVWFVVYCREFHAFSGFGTP